MTSVIPARVLRQYVNALRDQGLEIQGGVYNGYLTVIDGRQVALKAFRTGNCWVATFKETSRVHWLESGPSASHDAPVEGGSH